MPTKNYDRTNFHKHTFCIFNEVEMAVAESLKPNYKSNSGSVYYFVNDGVYRLSNHWGRAANCKWRLQKSENSSAKIKLGYAKWNAFHHDNEIERLYFITSDPDNNVTFNHKDNGNHTTELLRTAPETSKRIRQIRNLLSNEGWTKYFPYKDIAAVKSKIISELIETDKPLQLIKTEVRGIL